MGGGGNNQGNGNREEGVTAGASAPFAVEPQYIESAVCGPRPQTEESSQVGSAAEIVEKAVSHELSPKRNASRTYVLVLLPSSALVMSAVNISMRSATSRFPAFLYVSS